MALSFNAVFILAGLAALLSLAAFFCSLFVYFRFRGLFKGEKPKNLQGTLIEIQRDLERFNAKNEEIDSFLKSLHSRIKKSVQYVGLVRFNPYDDVGGNQSFALAVMDENKDGFVVSSLYGRESNRVYAKPLSNGVSEHQLSNEEKEAIKKAFG